MKSSFAIPIALAALALPPMAAAQSPVVGGLHHAGADRFAGAVLAGELACAACHSTTREAFAPKAGPDLSLIGSRANAAHLRDYIASPSTVKPGTTMPDVLAHLPEAEREETANAIAHYLASLGTPPVSVPPAAESVERGAKLYHSVGCVACHSPEKPLAGSVPLGPLEAKYSVASLSAFLQEPLAARPSGRMPDSHLDSFEADDIASYLLRAQQAAVEFMKPDAALAERGKLLFKQHRCDACHETGEKPAALDLPPLDKLRSGEGCLSAKPGAWPHYPLSEEQRSSLKAALGEVGKEWEPEEKVGLTLTRMNCIACHQRGELGGIPADRNDYFTGREESLGEQGRIPPGLTGVGAKLKAEWLREVLANGGGVRTAMNTRMPKFGAANTAGLAEWLKQLDTLPPMPFERLQKADKPDQVGREMVGAKGLNCIACHTFRGRSAAIPGPELTTMTERLEEKWFHHFLAQPQRFVPLIVMPGFWPDGKSTQPDILGGDPGRQRDAIWQYLSRGPEAGEPAGLVLEPLVIEVKDEPVIVRRAFPGIGKRGIGVGYPGGINLAFDATQMRLATVWSGGFIEASGLWRGQGSGQARLLGEAPVQLPAGPAFAVLAAPADPWPAAAPAKPSFKGYHLDARRRPVFRYAPGDFSVEDAIVEKRDEAGKLYFERTLRIASPPAGLHFRAAADPSIEPRGANEFVVGKKLLIRATPPLLARDTGAGKELLLPAAAEMKLEYHFTNPS